VITLTVAGEQRTVAGGKLSLPRSGVWVANLIADCDIIPTGAGIVTLSGVDMPAHVQRAELVKGMLHVRVVGGAGGLGKPAKAKHYRNPVVKHVLGDLLADAGERLSSSSTSASLGTSLGFWTSLRLPIGSLLSALAEVVGGGCTWRVLYDGSVWFGIETWPACPSEARVMDVDAWNACQLVGTDALGIWPGTTLGGRRIDLVVHDFSDPPRSRVWFAEGHA
jgi:hypothetical protein